MEGDGPEEQGTGYKVDHTRGPDPVETIRVPMSPDVKTTIGVNISVERGVTIDGPGHEFA